jgi:hypothetical protein
MTQSDLNRGGFIKLFADPAQVDQIVGLEAQWRIMGL